MKRDIQPVRLAFLAMLTVATIASLLPTVAVAQDVANSPFVVTGETGSAHIHLTPELTRQLRAQQGIQTPSGVLSYHGGPIMTGVNVYVIFWVPSKLQTGGPTSLSSKYEAVTKQFLADYPYHGIANNSTQYYSTKSGVNTYFVGIGAVVASYVDTDPYPASGCTDVLTPGNCITDAQLQTELAKVLSAKGWTSGLNKIYVVYTSTGEGSCFDGTSSSCAYTQYCAYHSYYGSTTSPVIYANMPYANTTYCYDPTAGQHAPSGDVPSDAAANLTSHEVTEATTDPEGTAWWDSGNGYEIGDLCAWIFGSADWDGGLANHQWNGHYYDLQLEYDNHVSGCVKIGP